jgi:tRNA(adenine34) deaminase
MGEALRLAKIASQQGEVPVGALIVRDGFVVGQGFDARESRGDPTAHAEVLAIRDAATRLGSWRLNGCTMYVTLEPCTMCMGAIISARLPCVVYGAASPKSGAVESVLELANVPQLNHRVRIRSGVRAQECSALLATFFEQLRKRRSQKSER